MHKRISFAGVFKTVILGILLGSSYLRPAEAFPGPNDAASMFYTHLSPYGTWVHHHLYGRVWFPRHVPRYWRPYTDGYWAYTRDYGWLWASDWTWGWATDHYGRWVWDDWYGWLWVPGTIWGPAWVVWRYGGGYVSWAPMPPQYVWRPYAGYSAYYFDFDRYLGWDCWVTTHEREFTRRHGPRRYIAPHRNREILGKTRYLDPPVIAQNRIVNQGVPLKTIERAMGVELKPEQPRLVDDMRQQTADRREQRQGEVTIFRPFDRPPTPDTLGEEQKYASHLAEQTEKMQRAPAYRVSRDGQSQNLRVPGRMKGMAIPPDDLGGEEALSILPDNREPSQPLLTLPDGQESSVRKPRNEEKSEKGAGADPIQGWRGEAARDDGTKRWEETAHRGQDQFGRQRQIEQERLHLESIRQKEDAVRQQVEHLERQRLAEEERMRNEMMRQQENALEQQQIESQRRQRVEQDRSLQEAIGQREEAARRQDEHLERQRRAEQERMQEDRMRRQEVTRQQQREMERQRQAKQQSIQQEAIRQQQEANRQRQIESEQRRLAGQERLMQREAQRQREEAVHRQAIERERQPPSIRPQQMEIQEGFPSQQVDGGRGRRGREIGGQGRR